MLENLIIILIRVAFLTLLELKILGYIQLLKGPNKIRLIGLLQPFSDAIKLFNKENILILKSNYYIYLYSPIISIILILMLWLILPIFSNIYSINLIVLYIICILRIGVYTLIISGWSSNSIYSLIGSLLAIAQTISYEVRLILIIIRLLILIENFTIFEFYNYQKFSILIIILFPISLILLVSILAELNLTPFDFSEGESELVSGFNIEYISGLFAIIFIAEYGIILFIRFLFSIIFLGGNFISIFFYIKFIILFIIIIWILGSFPLFLYDNLIYLTWKFYLLISLNYLLILLIFKIN